MKLSAGISYLHLSLVKICHDDRACAACPFCGSVSLLENPSTHCAHLIKIKGDMEPEEVIFDDLEKDCEGG